MGKKTVRYVDRPAFNHLIVLPVFWISNFWLDDKKLFTRALRGFVTSQGY